jgi:two-component system sensor histidine kinase KdpD
VLTALKCGFWEATVSSLVAVAFLDYFFAPPILGFHVADVENWVALASFEITALIISRLSSQLEAEIGEVQLHQRNTQKRYALSRRLLGLSRQETSGPQIASVIKDSIGVDGLAVFDSETSQT